MRNNLVKTAILAGGLALLAGPFATASAAIGDSTTGDFGSETVGPFDNFDTSSIGALLIKGGSSGGTFDGYYQSSVVDFTEGFSSVPSPGLDAGDYELTIVAHFTGEFFFPSGKIEIGAGGSVEMYLDDTPDSDLGTDTGFTDGTLIASGAFTGGDGTFLMFGPGTGVGASTLLADMAPSSVFDPMIDSIEATFTQQTNPAYASIPSVMGEDFVAGEDLLLQADGNIQLSAVPLPAAAWLFMSALVGLGFTARRRTV